MKWTNLKSNRCPKCSKPLGFSPHEEMLFCNELACGFQISQYRCETLVTQMNARALTGFHPRDNFADLQSLNRQPAEETNDEEAMLDRLGI